MDFALRALFLSRARQGVEHEPAAHSNSLLRGFHPRNAPAGVL
jgi:hypothetical protein